MMCIMKVVKKVIIEAVNSVNTTNEVETNTNVYNESSCDEIDSFVKF